MDADSTSAVLVEGAYRYARIPEWVLFHDELTATAKLAYAALDRYAGATAKAWPGIPTLAKRLGMDTSTVRRAIRSLEEAGALVTTPRFVDGRQTSNHYRLVGDAPVPTRPGAGAGVPPGAGAGGEAGAGAWGENESQKDREPDEREPCSVEVADAPTPKPRSPQQRLADARIEALALVTRADATRPPAWYKRASKVLRDLGQPDQRRQHVLQHHHRPRRQPGGVGLPAPRGFDVQAAARALRKVRMPAQAHRLRRGGAVGDGQVHFQRVGREHEALAQIEGERPVGVGGVRVGQLGRRGQRRQWLLCDGDQQQ